MIYRTIAARDNVTISADVDAHDYVNTIADLANQSLEDNKDKIAQAMSDLVMFGQTTLDLH